MTLAWVVARIAAVVAVLTIAFNLLPDAGTYDTTPLAIPDEIWNPILAVLGLNRYFPIDVLLVIFGIELAIMVGMAGIWVYAFLARHLFGS